jgi:hypothetical protein
MKEYLMTNEASHIAANCAKIFALHEYKKLPLWSSGHSSWLQIQRSRVRFPGLPNFLGSYGSETLPAQPLEDPLCWPRNNLYQQNSTLPHRPRRISVGIVRLQTKSHRACLLWMDGIIFCISRPFLPNDIIWDERETFTCRRIKRRTYGLRVTNYLLQTTSKLY